MIKPGITDFPNNVVEVIALRIPTFIDRDLNPIRRPLRPSDPAQSIGIFPSTKMPDRESIELASVEPTLKTYNLIVQSMVKNTKEEDAVSIHSIFAQMIWRLLYRDNVLRAGLTTLSVMVNNDLERFQRSGITIVRYLSNEVEGTFIHTSWTEYWFETETVRTS